jgi:hypothetical protein
MKMRKTIGILLMLTQFSCSKTKQDGLILKVQFHPEKIYCISTIRGSETVIKYSGQEIAMRKLKSMRIKNPTISNVKSKTDTELVIEKKSAGSSLPVRLIYKRTLSLNGKNEIPEGTVVNGEIKTGQLPDFKSVTSAVLGFDQKEQLLKTARSTFEHLDFQEHRLKIGDQFSTDHPGSIPMEGSLIETVVTTTYKLLGIKNRMAQFEVSQSYRMTPKMNDNSFSGKGIGKGKLTYDIENFLITEYSMKTELVMNKKLDYFEFDLKTDNEFSQTMQICKQ